MNAYVRLCAQMTSHQLNFFIWEKWYKEFLDCMNAAAQRVDERRDAADADVKTSTKGLRR
jgi:hypothetical protein